MSEEVTQDAAQDATEEMVQDVATDVESAATEHVKEAQDATQDATEEKRREDYSFDTDDDDEADAPESPEGGEDGAEAEYSVEWPEGYEASDALSAMVNEAARETGVTDKALGAYTARMIEVLEAKQAEREDAEDAALKEAWGRDYRANKKAAREFMRGVMADSGLSAEDAKIFANARGFRVLYALSQKVGGGAVHLGTAKADEANWAVSAMSDKEHPDYKALRDPRDPRHKEVTQRYFRAKGARV